VNRRDAVFALFWLVAAAVPFTSLAQQRKRPWRVGIVWGGTKVTIKANEEAFLLGMKEHGYELRRDLIIDARYADGNPARYPALVDEILALRPDVLIGANTGVAIAMKSRSKIIPIVLGTSGDPVGDGLVQSLARPGGNVTGVSLQLVDLGAKHIEIMAELLPRIRRVALLQDLSGATRSAREKYEQLARAAAAAKGLLLEVHRVDSLEEIRQTFRTLETLGVDALLIGGSPRFNALRREICESAANIRLPSIAFTDDFAQDGALVSYAPSFVEAIRRTAYYVDRIFKGAKPAELPIEQPTKFSLVINARTAKTLGITIPQSILLRADRVIE
jgi:putative ABC transport system substrate-binding protein